MPHERVRELIIEAYGERGAQFLLAATAIDNCCIALEEILPTLIEFASKFPDAERSAKNTLACLTAMRNELSTTAADQ
jgi:hypothetical protein